MIVYKFLLMIALVRVLLATDKPFLCSSIYGGVVFLVGLIFSEPLLHLLIFSSIGYGLACLYFWLLDRLDGNEWLWWPTAVVGIGLIYF